VKNNGRYFDDQFLVDDDSIWKVCLTNGEEEHASLRHLATRNFSFDHCGFYYGQTEAFISSFRHFPLPPIRNASLRGLEKFGLLS
jgi:hypothetical protein